MSRLNILLFLLVITVYGTFAEAAKSQVGTNTTKVEEQKTRSAKFGENNLTLFI